jgi:hypothetical protein
MLPDLAYLLNHPMLDEKGKMIEDYAKHRKTCEMSLSRLHQLAGPAHKAPPVRLSDYIDQLEEKPETD